MQATLRAGAEAARRATVARRAGAAATGIAAAAEEVSVKAIVSAGARTKVPRRTVSHNLPCEKKRVTLSAGREDSGREIPVRWRKPAQRHARADFSGIR